MVLTKINKTATYSVVWIGTAYYSVGKNCCLWWRIFERRTNHYLFLFTKESVWTQKGFIEHAKLAFCNSPERKLYRTIEPDEDKVICKIETDSFDELKSILQQAFPSVEFVWKS